MHIYTHIRTQVQGTTPFFGNWTETRHIGTPAARDGTFRSTEDFYLQHPHEWWTGGGPDHGFQWTQASVYVCGVCVCGVCVRVRVYVRTYVPACVQAFVCM